MKNKTFILVMLWFTILTIWAVSSIKSSLHDSRNITVQGVPAPAVPQPYQTVHMDKDTVWIIDPLSSNIKVISHDKDGYHITQATMDLKK
ncbi:hypothetical protein GCM10008018_56270 [Paenibacillus marchantiophytorum]|uniref:Uncharacterized protein n=1 Tax=Paenibacillus marchantiophytorum TaxID=1619310 RepID=A0ABQ1F949_9BACL|nr:hypothetical protein [Paenibacillus marchantiophytorum]GGA02964.1 hypothetical protein GCM10008018_56270 [Paenibacillus marchantiophytorum]